MIRPIATLAAVASWALATPSPGSAQQRLGVSGGATLAQLRVHHAGTPFGEEVRSAPEIGFEGTVVFRRLSLRLRYAEADLSSDTAIIDRGAAVAELALLGAPFPWLRAGVGYRRRAFEETQEVARGRWVVWDAIAAAEFPLLGETVTGSAELHGAFAGQLQELRLDASRWRNGVVGEVGIRVVVPNYPLWLRLGYRIERQRASGGREDVMDGLTLLLGAGAR